MQPSSQTEDPNMTCICHKRTIFTLLIGSIVGLIFSPFSLWIFLDDPQINALGALGDFSPLCRTFFLPVNLTSATANSTPSTEPTVPPPQFPHNRSALSERELLNHIEPPKDADSPIRHRHLSSELAERKLLLVGVVTAKKYLHTRALSINRTWGKEASDLYFFSSPSDDPNLQDLPVVTLPDVNDTQYPPQRKVYHMLKYMYENHIDNFDFFMRADDDVYVKVDMLLELLKNTNPAQDIYMGCPGFGKPKDRERIQLEEDEHYCMGGPGVIFSRSALRKLGPHLNDCLSTVVVSYNEDVEVGRCLSKMLQLQCTWSWETTFFFWTDYKRILATPELYKSNAVKKAITLHPLKYPELMYRVHQYMQELRLKKLMQEATHIQSNIEQVTSYLPAEKSRYGKKQWMWYELGVNPKSRFEITIWEYFNSTRLFLTYEHMPVVGLPGRLKTGINTALEVLLDVMNTREGGNNPFVPPYHLYDGFTVSDPSSGIQYVLHMSVHRQSLPSPINYVANVFLPLQGAGMATYQEARQVLNSVVHLIVNVARSHDVSSFLAVYESVCLKQSLQTHLHIVLFGNNQKQKEKVELLQQKYPHDDITLHTPENANFSYAYGFNYVSQKLEDSDLMVFFDHTFVFTSEFLDHCRVNAVRGRQAYFPILFSFYKPELVKKFIPKHPMMLISADTGFFLRYNYQVVAIYKSDFAQMGGFGSSGKRSTNDDVRFVDKLLSTHIYLMRALDPYVRRYYRPRSCRGLRDRGSHLACLNSRAEAIGSKKILGSLLASHDLLDKV